MTVRLATYTPGTLAYLDVFGTPFVPCKVTAVSGGNVTVTLTATRGAYRRGEVLTYPHATVVPRNHVYTTRGQYRIRNTYRWANVSLVKG